jgi:hypothetical protein
MVPQPPSGFGAQVKREQERLLFALLYSQGFLVLAFHFFVNRPPLEPKNPEQM